VARLKRERRALFLTPHVLYELYRGVSRTEGEGARVERLRQVLGTLPFEHHAAREAARIADSLRGEGIDLPLADLLIGASTIVWGDCQIITRDVRHFMPLEGFGLRVLAVAPG